MTAPRHVWGTINCDGINASGDICGVTTTSGLAWKIPGRVGDSPILGAGLYVDGGVGAAGSTGRGEANLFGLSSFLVVELMRQGRHPKDAGLEALRRIRANTVEKRLRKGNGDPNFNVTFYALNARGEFAAVALYAEDDNDRGWAGQVNGRRGTLRGVHRERRGDAQLRGADPGSAAGRRVDGSLVRTLRPDARDAALDAAARPGRRTHRPIDPKDRHAADPP